MTPFRRLLVVAVLMFWQGGFVFFAGVVVPIGRDELGPQQTAVTNRVTYFINLAGACALPVLLWDACVAEPSARRRRLRLSMWTGMLTTLLLQLFLYREMNAALGNDSSYFHLEHRVYLWICTVQFVAAVAYLTCMVPAWRATDHQAGRRLTAENAESAEKRQ